MPADDLTTRARVVLADRRFSRAQRHAMTAGSKNGRTYILAENVLAALTRKGLIGPDRERMLDGRHHTDLGREVTRLLTEGSATDAR